MTFLSGKSDRSRGFTLIELLVVISIIGVLSTVVLAALNGARNKAKDGAIKQLAVQMRNVYELEYLNKRSYAGVRSGLYTSDIGKTLCSGAACYVTIPSGCTSLFNNSTEAEKICLSAFSNGVAINGFVIGTSGVGNSAFVNDYAVFIQYPSTTRLGRCLGSSGKTLDVVDSNSCFVSGVGF